MSTNGVLSTRERLRERRQAETDVLSTERVRLLSAISQPRADYRKPPPEDTRYRRHDRTNPVAAIFDAVAWRNNLSQRGLADLLGVDHTHISHIRAQRRVPTRELVLAMVEQWPMTDAEVVELCTLFQVIPPGYQIEIVKRRAPMGP